MEGIENTSRPRAGGVTRVKVLSGIAAILSMAGAFGVAPRDAAAQASPGITFALSAIPATMVNAHWDLETGVGSAGLNWVSLTEGTVPAGGSLSIPISLTAALQTVNDHFMVVMYQVIDSSHAYMGNALLGVVHSDLVDGATFSLVPLVNQVPVYHSDADALAAGSCPNCIASDNPGYVRAPSSSPGSVAAQPPTARPSTPTTTATNNVDLYTPAEPSLSQQIQQGNLSVPVLCTGPYGGECWGPASPVLGPVNGPGSGGGTNPPTTTCPLTGGCVTTDGQAQGVGTCQGSFGFDHQTNDCVDAANDFHAEVFRGWSNKVPGDTDTYLIHNNYKQTWDNGYRTQSGPFSNDGTTSKSYGGGSDITYQKRGDCWSPSAPGDDSPPLCDGTGWDSNWGQDAWRWEKHTYKECDPGSCNESTYEIVFDNTFNGGNDISHQNDLTGDTVRPGLITNDAYGPDWARWNPDTSKETKLQTEAKISHGATMDVSWTKSYGGFDATAGASYSSSETDTTYSDEGNAFTFRGPASGLPWMGEFYNFDGNQRTWAWEYWTCQFNNRYIGAMNETELYTNDTQCWDASQ